MKCQSLLLREKNFQIHMLSGFSADALGRNWNNPDGFVDELKQRDDAEVACMGGGLPQEHMAAMSVLPLPSVLTTTDLWLMCQDPALSERLPVRQLCSQVRPGSDRRGAERPEGLACAA